MAEELKAELAIDEAAAYTNCSPATLRRAVRAGKLPRRYISSPHGVALVFMPAELDRWRASSARAVVEASQPAEASQIGEQLAAPVAQDLRRLLHDLHGRMAQQDQALAEARKQILTLREQLGTIDILRAQAAAQDRAIAETQARLTALQDQLILALPAHDEPRAIHALAQHNELLLEAPGEQSRHLLKRIEPLFDAEQREAQRSTSQKLSHSLAERVTAREVQPMAEPPRPPSTDYSQTLIINPDQGIAASRLSAGQAITTSQQISVPTTLEASWPTPENPPQPPSLAMRIAQGSGEETHAVQDQSQDHVALLPRAAKRGSWIHRLVYGD